MKTTIQRPVMGSRTAPAEFAPSADVAAERMTKPAAAAQADASDTRFYPRTIGREVLTIYLGEIGRVPLLNREDEDALAARVEKGDARAREMMIRANLRLVVKIAYDYDGLGLPLLDLISEGNMGLMKAVDRYHMDRGAKFSSYASYWIRQCMMRGLCNQGRTVRIPAYLQSKLTEMRRAEVVMEEELGHSPSNAELGKAVQLTPREVARLRGAAARPASLDASLGDKDSECFGDVLPDERAPAPDVQLALQSQLELLRELLARLNDRERSVIARRFGLDGDGDETLDDVGADLGVTRERVRQIQEEAMEKLRRMFHHVEPDASL